MKKLFFTCTLLFFLTQVFAQKEFALDWKFQFDVDVDWRMINEKRTLVFAGNLAEVAMMDATSGKQLWKINIKEKYGKRKAEDIDWEKNAGVVFITMKGEKKEPDVKHYLDEKTGNEITEAEFKSRKPEYVWIWRGSVKSSELNTRFRISYEKKKIVGSMGKGTKSPIDIIAEGDINWRTTIEAKYIRTLCANAIPRYAADFGGDFLKIMYANNKVFVLYEGMSVLDARTGKLLWSTDLDNTEFDFGLFKSTQTLGRSGYPEVTNDAVYVADLSKGQSCIKKFDLETGKLLWAGAKFDKDDVVPDLKVSGNVLLAQFGGRLEVQTYIPGTSGRPDVCKTEVKFAGNAGIKAYDINSGSLLWETSNMKALNDKFNGAISNILVRDDKAYFASDKNMYCVKSTTGEVVFSLPIKTMKVGKPKYLFFNNGNIILEAEDGIAAISVADGKQVYATNTGKCIDLFNEGEAWFIWTGKDAMEREELVRIDLESGAVYGKIKDTAYPYFTQDGAYLIKFDGAKVLRYKTK